MAEALKAKDIVYKVHLQLSKSYKRTGQGSELGLSLSNDIVKAHGGQLKVETKEGEESEFIVTLPLG